MKSIKLFGFAKKAHEIGISIDHRSVVAQSQSNLAIIASYQGRLQDAISLNEAVIGARNYLDEDRTLAAALSNLAQDYQIYGDFEKSRNIQEEAITLYEKLNLPLNLSIAYCGLGLLETELENYEAAEYVLKKSADFARASNYFRGICATEIYLADCAAGKGDFETAEALLESGFQGFADLKLEEALNYEIKARCLRLRSRLQDAEKLLKEGLRLAQDFPFETASLQIEHSKLLLALGDEDQSLLAKKKAVEIYKAAGATLRSQRL